MLDPFTWPIWLQAIFVTVVVLAAVLAWFTVSWGVLLASRPV
jgi:hypothetical protein